MKREEKEVMISEEVRVGGQLNTADASMAVPAISIIVPVYNEEASISSVLKLLLEVNWASNTVEIIIVDDGSTDGTANEVAAFVALPFIKVVQHAQNMGKGAALKTGFKRAIGTVIVVQDADMEYLPGCIPDLVKPILENKADIVFGSRFKGNCKGMSLSHYIGNKILSLTARILYEAPITDIMTGSKAFRRSVIEGVDLKERGFGVEVELTSKSLQMNSRYFEIPIEYNHRTAGESKIRPSDGFKSLFQLFSNAL